MFCSTALCHKLFSFTDIKLQVTVVTPHDEEYLLYESGGRNSCIWQRLCFAVEGVIFIRCNSVSSPAVWRGNVSLPLAQDIHHLVTATQGSSSIPGVCVWEGSWLSLCLPLNSRPWWWLMDSCVPPSFPIFLAGIVYFLQRQTRRNDLENLKLSMGGGTNTNLIWCSCPQGPRVQDWCSEMSFPTLWWHKVVVFQRCGGHMTDTGWGCSSVCIIASTGSTPLSQMQNDM